MKEQEQTREPGMRRGFVVAVGGLGAVLLTLVALTAWRPSKDAPAPVTADMPNAPESAAPSEEPQAGATVQRRYEIPKLGQGKEKPQVVRAADSPLTDIKLSFKLDPRLTGSLYMGDRWVCPPTYFKTGEGRECSFEATINGIDGRGKAMQIQPTIQAADPSMVTVSPGPGKAVQITAHRPGKTSLEVAALGMTKRLPLNVLPFGTTLVVEVYQQ